MSSAPAVAAPQTGRPLSAGPTPADDTLLALLKPHAVPLKVLRDRFGPLLELVRALIGVVPNCDRYLEIWPPAFRTYNILVPNFLNLPFSIFGIGAAPADIVGLGMYVASRAAECAYCSAHTCSFALRRGASVEKMAQALVGGTAPFTEGELATVAVARSLARVPCELTASEREALERCFSPEEAEWIVLGVVMMGFLNKFMDAIGVELEASTAAEVSETMGPGWSAGRAGRGLDPAARFTPPPARDTLKTKLGISPHLPTALRLDNQWQRGVPNSWPAVGDYLRAATGHSFPVLSRIRHARVIRGVASMLRENLDRSSTVVGLETKVLAGVVFAEVVANRTLGADVRALAQKNGVVSPLLDDAARFAGSADDLAPGSDPRVRAALLLVRAASPSPSTIDASVVSTCLQAELAAPAIVELVSWISVLQMMHRLTSYFVA